MNEILLERELTTKEFIESINEGGNRIVFQLHSDPPYVFRSFSLNGQKPHIHTVLDFLAGKLKRDLRYVWGFSGERWKISIAGYIS